jgi:hypothetical protein
VCGLQPVTTACSNKLWEQKAMSLFVEDQKVGDACSVRGHKEETTWQQMGKKNLKK